MKLYICGPVTGFSDLNLPTFEEGLDQLDRAGYEVVIPHEFVPPDATHTEAMALCFERLEVGDIDGLALLPGWPDSAGSRQECALASQLGIECKSIDRWLFEAEIMGQKWDSEKATQEIENNQPTGNTACICVQESRNNGYMDLEEEK